MLKLKEVREHGDWNAIVVWLEDICVNADIGDRIIVDVRPEPKPRWRIELWSYNL